MKKVAIVSALALVILVSFQILKPVKWEFSTSKKSTGVGEVVEIVFKGKIDKGWYLYSSELKVEGPMPTQITVTPNAGFQLVGKLIAVSPKEKYDKILEQIIGCKDQV